MNLARVAARVQNLIGFGKTTTTMNDAGATPTVQVEMHGGQQVIDGLQSIGLFGFSSSMPPDTSVVTLFAGGNRSRGVILGTVDPASRRRNLQPGEVAIGPSGDIEIHFAPGLITIKHPGKVRVETPRLECTGEIVAHCDSASVTLGQHIHGTGSPPRPGT